MGRADRRRPRARLASLAGAGCLTACGMITFLGVTFAGIESPSALEKPKIGAYQRAGAAAFARKLPNGEVRGLCSKACGSVTSPDMRAFCDGRCGNVGDFDARQLCFGECGSISDPDLRHFCGGDCGNVRDPDLRSFCTASCGSIKAPALRNYCSGACSSI